MDSVKGESCSTRCRYMETYARVSAAGPALFCGDYLGALAVLGVQVVRSWSGNLDSPHNLLVAALLSALVFGAQFTEIAIGQITLSLVDTVLVASLFILPLPYPLFVAMLGTLPYLLRSGRHDPREAVFNAALIVTRLGITGIVISHLYGAGADPRSRIYPGFTRHAGHSSGVLCAQ